ncbi:MAG: hypothetical protein HY815_27820 [Candidatus Riflebacteria bacterium]|nr:hypothetical protein [Candidatus Riflebacteria bacterium]
MKTSSIVLGSFLFCLVLLPALTGAGEQPGASPAADPTPSAAPASPVPSSSPAAAPAPAIAPTRTPVSPRLRIVFVGKEVACACTRKAIDESWKVMEPLLAARKDVAIEKLQIDTQTDKVDVYRKMKPMMALPAIYVLDGKGELRGLLQGKVTAEQFGKLLE